MEVEITNRQLEIIEAAGRIITESGVSGLTIKRLAKEMATSIFDSLQKLNILTV